MVTHGADEARAIEVWNRAACGEPASRLQGGDVALAHALRFLGYAEGDGLVSALEHEQENECVGTGSSAFGWFGIKDAVRLVDEVALRWAEIVDGDLTGDSRLAALEELEVDADQRFGLLDLGERLTAALRTALTHRPECFADQAHPRAVAPGSEPVAIVEERPGWAVRIPAEEKLRRTVLAYEAFGVRAEVEDARLVLWPPDDDAGWEVLDEIDRLLEHRYPTVEER